jgi:hypothetical protein
MLVCACALVGCAREDSKPHASGGAAGDGGAGGASGPGSGVGGQAGDPNSGSLPLTCEAACPDCAARNAKDLFAYGKVPVFELSLPKERWELLQKNARDEQFEPACVAFEGQSIGKVGLRFKGSYGTLNSCFDAAGNMTCTKLSMKLKFNEQDSALRFYGLKRLNLHSMIYDETKLRERLAYDLFREMGLVSPRSAWAEVRVNGESLGLYSMVEQVDGVFTQDRWPAAGNGNLYKEAWPVSEDAEFYTEHLETNEQTADVSAFVKFAQELAAAETPALGNEVLGRYTELQSLYRYMAVDDAVMDWDGVTAFYTDGSRSYTMNHNYYFYQAEQQELFSLIPWDKDSTFNPQSAFSQVPRWDTAPSDCSLTYPVWGGTVVAAPGCDPLFRALGADPDAYSAAAQELLDGPLAEKPLLAKIDALAAFIEDAIDRDPAGAGVSGWRGAVERLKRSVPILRQRLEHLRDHAPIVPFSLDPASVNDFESLDSLGMTVGTTLTCNPASSVSQISDTEEPLSGKASLRLDFEYRNQAKPWEQWIYYSVPFTGGAQDYRARTGLRLRVRADEARVLRVDLESPTQTASTRGVRVGWDVPVGPVAKTVELRFEDARVPDWAVSQDLDPKVPLQTILQAITGVALHPYCNGRTGLGFLPEGETDPGFVQVDDVEVFAD